MSRQAILGRLKSHISNDKSEDTRRNEVANRLNKRPVGVLPDITTSQVRLINRFKEKAIAASASVERVGASQVGNAVTRWLRNHNLPGEARIGSDRRLNDLKKQAEKSLTLHSGPSDGHDLVGISHGECGIAETGTLALFSGSANPTTINFLPENHIVLVSQKDILRHYEEIWPRIRRRFGKGQMPRSVNLITGPSRSADIEQTLILGAHGPVRLHIIIVSD
jgi:L-lactate dehydrogenase complex protein LldG